MFYWRQFIFQAFTEDLFLPDVADSSKLLNAAAAAAAAASTAGHLIHFSLLRFCCLDSLFCFVPHSLLQPRRPFSLFGVYLIHRMIYRVNKHLVCNVGKYK